MAGLKAVCGFFAALYRGITRRYTIMLVPHSEKKIYNLHINVATILCISLVLVGVLGSFFWYGSVFNTTRQALADKDLQAKDAQANLDNIRDETSNLLSSAKSFEAALSGLLSMINKSVSDAPKASSGDFSSLFNIQERAEGSVKEVNDLKRVSELLVSTTGPLYEIGNLLNSQSTLLTDIPSLWPVKGGIGHISMYFGQNEHPFTGQWYIHKGIDLSTYRQGDPIIATADGTVVNVDFDLGGFGNYVVIRHKHGFYTRYAHMLRSSVANGDRVQQGQVIGYIGNTGLSTGPHLHYEVHIGSDVVDPLKYINLRSNLANANR